MDNIYEKKYLKYKEKYNLLKLQINNLNQTGGINYKLGLQYVFIYPKDISFDELYDPNNNNLLKCDFNTFTNKLSEHAYWYIISNNNTKDLYLLKNVSEETYNKQLSKYNYALKINSKIKNLLNIIKEDKKNIYFKQEYKNEIEKININDFIYKVPISINNKISLITDQDRDKKLENTINELKKFNNENKINETNEYNAIIIQTNYTIDNSKLHYIYIHYKYNNK
jgi:hypothetical protein